MAALQEVVVSSCLNDSVVSAYMWDAANGTTLITYRGDTSISPTGLSLLADQYVVAALQGKPFLRVWPVNSQQAVSGVRLVCPGRVTHAQASPDNCYLVVTVAEKIHLYQFATGKLLGTGSRHFQPVSVVRWARDGSFLVCGGEDGLVTVWPLATLAAAQSQSAPEPRYVMSDHSLPVSDLVVTIGYRPRLLTVSADRTCKIYDLGLGTLLLSLVFDRILTAVAISVLETQVFVGADNGSVLQFSLHSPPRHVEYHLTDEECAPVFSGHSGAVRCLSVSHCGALLLSGSVDSTIKIWHISSRQCLRTLQHKGPVTNAFFALRPKQLFDEELKPSLVICDFKSALGMNEKSTCVEIITQESLHLSDETDYSLFPEISTDSDARVASLQMEVDRLKSINAHLYKIAVDKVIADNKSSFKSEIKATELNQGERKQHQEKKEHHNQLQNHQEQLQRTKKKKNKKKNRQPSENAQNEKSAVTLSVNGVSQMRKKKRQRNKKNKNKAGTAN